MNKMFEFNDVDSAVKALLKCKKDGVHVKVYLGFIDFDNNEESGRFTTIDEGIQAVKKAQSVFCEMDDFIPHIMAYSKKQNVKNIKPEGTMHDILLFNYNPIVVVQK